MYCPKKFLLYIYNWQRSSALRPLKTLRVHYILTFLSLCYPFACINFGSKDWNLNCVDVPSKSDLCPTSVIVTSHWVISPTSFYVIFVFPGVNCFLFIKFVMSEIRDYMGLSEFLTLVLLSGPSPIRTLFTTFAYFNWQSCIQGLASCASSSTVPT